MLTTINFNDNFLFTTYKIRNIITYNLLSNKFIST